MQCRCRLAVTLPVAMVCAVVLATVSLAQSPSGKAEDPALSGAVPVPGVITQGSGTVSAGGLPAARAGDVTDKSGTIVEGSSNVFINGRPAATVGDRTGCGGITIGGSSNVFVNGKPLARAGDLTTGCDKK